MISQVGTNHYTKQRQNGDSNDARCLPGDTDNWSSQKQTGDGNYALDFTKSDISSGGFNVAEQIQTGDDMIKV
jgi:hypothetical protein